MSDVKRMLLDQLVAELDNEPPSDAGGHPSMEYHERAGAAWAEWDKRVAAWRLVLSVMLVNDAIEEHRIAADTKGRKEP